MSGRARGKSALKSVMSRYYEYFLLPVGIAGFLYLWQYLSGFYDPFILPSPRLVWERSLEFFNQPQLFFMHFLTTLGEAGGGFCLGALSALPVSYFLAKKPVLERLLTPYFVGIQAVPIVALAPLLVIWFGFGIVSKVLVAALITFFSVLTTGIAGLRSTDPRLRELLAIMGATKWQIFFKLEFPSALPYIFSGLRLGGALAVIGAVSGEFAGAGKGLGYIVNFARGSFDTPLLFAAIIALAVLGIGFYLLFFIAEYLAIPWKRKR
ncbi:MAG TPA: ABC transporter permease [Bacillota bacterium]